MKKVFLSIIAISCLVFTGCSNNNSNSSSSSNPTSNLDNPSNSSSESSSISFNSSTNSSEEEKIPTEKIDSFLASIKNNFTFEEKMNNIESKYLFDGDKIYDAINENYTTLEGDVYYFYAKDADGAWHKNFANETQQAIFKMPSSITTAFESLTWESYDSKTETFNGYGYSMNAKIPATLKIDADGVTLMFGNNIADFSNIGTTNLTLPENVIDDTIVDEKIYEDGKFNIVLLKDILEPWMKGGNTLGVDYFSATTYDDKSSIDRFIFIDAGDNRFNIGTIVNVYNRTTEQYEKGYQLWKTRDDSDLISKINDGSLTTTQNLKEYLKSNYPFDIDGGYIKIDETMDKTDFDTMTINIFNRLANIGYQGRDISNPGTKVEGLKLENVVFSFATVKSGVSAGLGLGYFFSWYHYYLINVGNECKWIKIDVASSEPRDELGPNYMVLNDNEDCWYVTSYEGTIIDKDNANLHTQPQE